MDTESFILNRREIVERLEARRAKDLSAYPFRMAENLGIQFPSWARWALSFASQGGAFSKVLQIGLPLAIPLLFNKKTPMVQNFLSRIFPPKA